MRHLLQLGWSAAERDFDAFGLRGRRGVGKTELVKETLRRHGSDTPCLCVEMDEGPQAHPLVFLRSVRDALAQKGLEALLDDQPPPASKSHFFLDIVMGDDDLRFHVPDGTASSDLAVPGSLAARTGAGPQSSRGGPSGVRDV